MSRVARTAEGEALAISIPRSEAHVIRHFQERMPYGLFVPDVPSEQAKPDAVTSPLPPAADIPVALARGSNVPSGCEQ